MFYISSQGHSATGWLSKILSSHPEIVCFHGTRSIPPYGSGKNDITPAEFVDGLLECEKNVRQQKQFGACHGFYGTSVKTAVESNNGTFLGIVRHPIMRVQSIFSAFVGNAISFGQLPSDTKVDLDYYLGKDFFTGEVLKKVPDINKNYKSFYMRFYSFYKRVEPNLQLFSCDKIIRRLHRYLFKQRSQKKNKRFSKDVKISKQENGYNIVTHPKNEIITAGIIQCFTSACQRTFVSDSEIFEACEEMQILKMEEYTKSPAYFEQRIILPVLKRKDSKLLEHAFQEHDHINYHTFKKNTPKETFDKWPSILQEIFTEKLDECSAKQLYKQYNYELP